MTTSDNDLILRGDALKALTEKHSRSLGAIAAIAALPAVTVGVRDFDVEVVRGNTGGNLALYFNDHRVAGSKPWGGGTPIHQFRVQGDDAKSAGILATIRDFQTVPVVKECLTTDAALPAVTVGVEQLRAAFDAGCENGWDHARWESVYDPQPLGCEDAFNKFLAALTTTPAPDVARLSEAAVHRAVLDWIRDDAGLAVKMSMTPVLANALTARILAALK